MTHLELALARARQESLRVAAELHREGRRAATHGRLVRQARRAERRRLSHADEAGRLRARIAQLEAGC